MRIHGLSDAYLISGDIIPAPQSVTVQLGERHRFTPPERLLGSTIFRAASDAIPMATNEEEHAVSTAMAGPPNENVYARRPAATLK